MWPFNRKSKEETRSSGSGYTSEIMAARESYISGTRGIAELTATAQSCIALWENGFAIADVDGTTMIDPASLGMMGRSLALRGEALFLIRDDGLVPCSDWDLSTRDGKPKAYRVSISEAGGAKTETVLAAEVLHIRIGVDPAAPWLGTAPLRRSQLTSGMLHAIETALSDVYQNAPIGSQIVPFPEATETELEKTARAFRGNRGKVLLRESVNVSAAGGPAPQSDWKPQDVSPDIQRTMAVQALQSSRDGVCSAFGVLPALFNNGTTGPLVRECQRHLAAWNLQPMAILLAQEASKKLGTTIKIDTMGPLAAYDAGARARSITAVVQAMALAKETGVDPQKAMALLDWSKEAEGATE